METNYDNTRICITALLTIFQEHGAHMVGLLPVCLGLGLAVTIIISLVPIQFFKQAWV